VEYLDYVRHKDRRPVHAHHIVDDACQQAAMPRDRERRGLNAYTILHATCYMTCNVAPGIQLLAHKDCADPRHSAASKRPGDAVPRRAQSRCPSADVAGVSSSSSTRRRDPYGGRKHAHQC
jgi:hypothetical protein